MRKLGEVFRLKGLGCTHSQVARSCQVARSTVREYLRRLEGAGLGLPLAEGLSEEELEARLFRQPAARGPVREVPDWAWVERERRRQKGVTLKLLWQEYRGEHPDGYGYTQFCEHYRRWGKGLELAMHQRYRAGEKMFVDWAGVTMPVVDAGSGQVRHAQVFVAALGASNYLYVEAAWTQQLPDWIEAHVHAWEYMGGVAAITVVDNTRSAVSRPCRYDPDTNPAYRALAQHYGTVVIPTRPRRSRDNAKAEVHVQITEREVLAPLRDQTFFSLGELNRRVGERVEAVNRRPMQKLGVSRRELYEELERPALKPLPGERYEYAEFHRARVNIDYHVEVRYHRYSVPYQLRGQQVEVRLSARIVEILHKGRRVATHLRDDRRGGYTTEPSHMPKAHREHLEWSPSRLIRWAGTVGPSCAGVAETIIEEKPHPEQGYRACLGLMRLAKRYGPVRMEAACRRAVALGVCSYRSIKSILTTGKDSEPLPGEEESRDLFSHSHENVRGERYYDGVAEAQRS